MGVSKYSAASVRAPSSLPGRLAPIPHAFLSFRRKISAECKVTALTHRSPFRALRPEEEDIGMGGAIAKKRCDRTSAFSLLHCYRRTWTWVGDEDHGRGDGKWPDLSAGRRGRSREEQRKEWPEPLQEPETSHSICIIIIKSQSFFLHKRPLYIYIYFLYFHAIVRCSTQIYSQILSVYVPDCYHSSGPSTIQYGLQLVACFLRQSSYKFGRKKYRNLGEDTGSEKSQSFHISQYTSC